VTVRTRVLTAAALSAALAAGVGAWLGGSALAAGTIVVGQTTDNAISCDQAGEHPTILQRAWTAGGPDYTAPSPGVITSFSSGQDGSSYRGLVLRPTGAADQYSLVGKSVEGETAGSGIVTVPARISVLAGDKIALQVLTDAGTASRCYVASPTDYATQSLPAAAFDPDAAGATADFSGISPVGNQAVNLSAELEPDADGDGYGDETQDLCPTDAARQDACPTIPPTPTPPATTSTPPVTTPATAPDTTLVGAVKKKLTKRVITLTFTSPTAGATYRCQVDKSAAKPCSSPYKQRYKVGKHTVTITAVDPATGLADTTPLVVKFKVKPKKR
jgi:hypothetical protein